MYFQSYVRLMCNLVAERPQAADAGFALCVSRTGLQPHHALRPPRPQVATVHSHYNPLYLSATRFLFSRSSAQDVVPTFLSCLESDQPGVANSALEKLAEFSLLAQGRFSCLHLHVFSGKLQCMERFLMIVSFQNPLCSF